MNTYIIVKGVVLLMTDEIASLLSVIGPVFYSVKLPVVITSGLEGPHGEKSLHYQGKAIDLRKDFSNTEHSETWQIHRQYIIERCYDLSNLRKIPFEIVEETDHLHVEWKSKPDVIRPIGG